MNRRSFYLSQTFLFSCFFTTVLFFSGITANAAVSAEKLAENQTVTQSHKIPKFQQWIVKKVTKKLEKRQAKIEKLMKDGKIAKARQMQSRLRTALIVGLIGILLLILGVLPVIGVVFYVLGAIAIVIALVLLILAIAEM